MFHGPDLEEVLDEVEDQDAGAYDEGASHVAAPGAQVVPSQDQAADDGKDREERDLSPAEDALGIGLRRLDAEIRERPPTRERVRLDDPPTQRGRDEGRLRRVRPGEPPCDVITRPPA